EVVISADVDVRNASPLQFILDQLDRCLSGQHSYASSTPASSRMGAHQITCRFDRAIPFDILPKSLLRIDRCLGPSFARSASPQCMSLIVVPGMQLASIAKRMKNSKSLTRSLRMAALRTTRLRNGKLRCTRRGRERRRGNGRL